MISIEKHMIRLLIVDDEKTTRDSLLQYLPWAELGIDSVRTAINGIEALELFSREPADILLTDVRMPKMNGLELAEKVRSLYPACILILLSAYADKHYLKQAIRLQVLGYIDKPVNPDEVKAIMRDAVSILKNERLRSTPEEEAAHFREKLTKTLVCETRGFEELKRTIPDAVPSYPPEQGFTAAALLAELPNGIDPIEREQVMKKLLGVCLSSEPFNLPSAYTARISDETIALILPRKFVKKTPRTRSVYDTLLDALKTAAPEGIDVALGVGRSALGLDDIPHSFASARAALELRFYRGTEAVLYPLSERPHEASLVNGELSAFCCAVRDRDCEQAERIARTLTKRLREEEPADIDSVRNIFFMFLLTLREAFPANELAVSRIDEEKSYLWQEITERATLSDLELLLTKSLGMIPGRNADETKSSKKVHEIERFIRARYTDSSLSLQSIAEHVEMSRTYLCAFYKNSTGRNLNEYITELRIERAKELLADCRIRTCDVVSQIGYRDVTYFSTLFKKIVGRTPSDFRNNS